VNNTAKIVMWVLLLSAVTVLLGFVESSRSEQLCTEILIDIDRSKQNFFIDEEDIHSMIHHEVSAIVNRPLAELNSNDMELQLNGHPSIKNAEVFKTLDGKLSIKIKQREPIMRVYSSNGDSYYMDKEGQLMPLSDKFTSRVMVANGFIYSPYTKFVGLNFSEELPDSILKRTQLDELFKYADFISKDPFWKAQIEQLHVNKDMDIELIPRVGNHTIVFGDANHIESKFEKLIVFYNKGLSNTGWNEYSVINLKYEGQVVCTKR
tara:strand:+ start:527 stop:1318 length:792 start_codon:yes stop_codon:yes gene_type:complete